MSDPVNFDTSVLGDEVRTGRQMFVHIQGAIPAASAMMLAPTVTGPAMTAAAVPSAAVRMSSTETLPAAMEALRRMPAASQVEAA